MRKFFLLFILIIFSCKREEEIQLDNPEWEKLFGEWWWHTTVDANRSVIDSSEGRAIGVHFDSLGKFYDFGSGKNFNKMNYKLARQESVVLGFETDQINYTPKNDKQDKKANQTFIFSGDTLILLDECLGCFTYYYLRRKTI